MSRGLIERRYGFGAARVPLRPHARLARPEPPSLRVGWREARRDGAIPGAATLHDAVRSLPGIVGACLVVLLLFGSFAMPSPDTSSVRIVPFETAPETVAITRPPEPRLPPEPVAPPPPPEPAPVPERPQPPPVQVAETRPAAPEPPPRPQPAPHPRVAPVAAVASPPAAEPPPPSQRLRLPEAPTRAAAAPMALAMERVPVPAPAAGSKPPVRRPPAFAATAPPSPRPVVTAAAPPRPRPDAPPPRSGRSAAPALALPAARAPAAAAARPAAAPRIAPTAAAAPAAPRPASDPGLPGVPLGVLAACISDRTEDALKLALIADVRGRTQCASPAGRYHFLETRNVNAFLMRIERAAGRGVGDRCAELTYAIDCLKRTRGGG